MAGAPIDTSLATMAEGMGTCWIGILVVAMLTLGYPAKSPAARPGKKLEEIWGCDGWQNQISDVIPPPLSTHVVVLDFFWRINVKRRRRAPMQASGYCDKNIKN